jgi:hypothetical protein
MVVDVSITSTMSLVVVPPLAWGIEMSMPDSCLLDINCASAAFFDSADAGGVAWTGIKFVSVNAPMKKIAIPYEIDFLVNMVISRYGFFLPIYSNTVCVVMDLFLSKNRNVFVHTLKADNEV